MDARPYLSLFVSEARRRLTLARDGLDRLAAGDDPKAVGFIEEQVHTLKGMSAQLQFPAPATLAHHLEDLTRAVKAHTIEADAATAEVLREGVERIAGMIDVIEAGGEPEPALDAEQAVQAHLRRAGNTSFTIVDPPSHPEPRRDPDLPRDDEVFAAVAELLAVAQRLRGLDASAAVWTEAQRVERTTRRLFTLLAHARQVGFETLVPQLRSHLRLVCRDRGREAELLVSGEETRVDPVVLAGLQGALVHMLTNAVVHGIEGPTERRRAGKPRVGQLRLIVERAGDDLVVSFSDDGRGFDVERIERVAGPSSDDESTEVDIHTPPTSGRRGRGPPRLTPEQRLRIAIQRAFQPGVSTTDTTDTHGGRGVGLGAIQQTVDGLGGRLEVFTATGQGSRFRLTVPVQQRIEELLLVRQYGVTLALAAHSLLGPPDGGVIRLRDGSTRRVDAVVGSVEGLVSPAPFPFNLLPRVNGTTVGPDGSILFVVDLSVAPPAPAGASA